MPKMRKVGGAWRTVADRYIKVNGQWRVVVESYRKVDGIWRKVSNDIYMHPYIINHDPALYDAGVYFDVATSSYRAYFKTESNQASDIGVGVRLGNLPEKSKISFELRLFEEMTGSATVTLYSNGTLIGTVGASQTVEVYTRYNISDELIFMIHHTGTTLKNSVNFAISKVRVNDVPIMLP